MMFRFNCMMLTVMTTLSVLFLSSLTVSLCDLCKTVLGGLGHRGSQLYFHITRYVLKRRREDTFWGAKSESRVSTSCFASKTVVFVLPIKYSGIKLVSNFQAVRTTSYHTQFRFLRT
jgi:hypothetical protein